MLRIPNPVSDPEVFVRVFCDVRTTLGDIDNFGLDDITRAMIDRGHVTSQGALGKEALRRSTRADRSRDPLYNQSKMYSELFRLLGWIHSTTSSLQFRFTPLGMHVCAPVSRDSLVRECLIGIAYPTEALSVQGDQTVRPFGAILRAIHRLRTLSRDEIIAGPLSISDDSDSGQFDRILARLEACRKTNGRLDTWIDAIARKRGITRRPTMENYTRFPLGVLSRSGWCNRASGKLTVTELGDLAAEALIAGSDWRLSNFQTLPAKMRPAFIRWTYYSMLDRAGVDVSAQRAVMKAAGSELLANGISGLKNAYFSPFQQLSAAHIAEYTPELTTTTALKAARRKSSVSVVPAAIARRAAEYHAIDVSDTRRRRESGISTLEARLRIALSRGFPLKAIVEDVVKAIEADGREQFYPLVVDLLCIIGLDCRLARAGQNYDRADAMIVDSHLSVPVEIKSPGEETEVSVKAIRQALENKVVLLARRAFPTTRDASTLVVGYNPPNERSDVHELMVDVAKAFDLHIGVLDIRALLLLALKCIASDSSVAISEISALRGVAQVS